MIDYTDYTNNIYFKRIDINLSESSRLLLKCTSCNRKFAKNRTTNSLVYEYKYDLTKRGNEYYGPSGIYHDRCYTFPEFDNAPENGELRLFLPEEVYFTVDHDYILNSYILNSPPYVLWEVCTANYTNCIVASDCDYLRIAFSDGLWGASFYNGEGTPEVIFETKEEAVKNAILRNLPY